MRQRVGWICSLNHKHAWSFLRWTTQERTSLSRRRKITELNANRQDRRRTVDRYRIIKQPKLALAQVESNKIPNTKKLELSMMPSDLEHLTPQYRVLEY